MLKVGDAFPKFKVKATVSNDIKTAFQEISNESYPDQWLVVFFWLKDFTFVCPTEIEGFAKLDKDFKDRGAQILGASTDSEFVHLAWRKDRKELQDLPFSMLADVKRELVSAFGIVDEKEGVAQRAVFIVDPEYGAMPAKLRMTVFELYSLAVSAVNHATAQTFFNEAIAA